MDTSRGYDIFISYSRKDQKKVLKYADFLCSLGYTVWIDRSGIESGDAFREVIVNAIEHSSVFLFFSSKSSNESKWTSSEIAIAIEENKKIIPIKIDNAKYSPSVRMDLVGLDYVDACKNDSEALLKIESTIVSLLGKRTRIKSGDVFMPEKKKLFQQPHTLIILASVLLVLVVSLWVLFKNQEDKNCIGETYLLEGTQGMCDRLVRKYVKEIRAEECCLYLMETTTGKIRAAVDVSRDSTNNLLSVTTDTIITNNPLEHQAYESSLMKDVSLIACLETGDIDENTLVHTENGVLDIEGRRLRDSNWGKGGSGTFKISEGPILSTNIGIWKLVHEAFGTPKNYLKALSKIGYGTIDSIPDFSTVCFETYTKGASEWSMHDFVWFTIGYNQLVTPIQMLTFLNAIPNSGTIIQPRYKKAPLRILRENSMSQPTLELMHSLYINEVEKKTGRFANSSIVKIAGNPSTSQFWESGQLVGYNFEFFVYFPADDPKYSMLIRMRMNEDALSPGILPGAGSMLGELVNEIVELLYYKNK